MATILCSSHPTICLGNTNPLTPYSSESVSITGLESLPTCDSPPSLCVSNPNPLNSYSSEVVDSETFIGMAWANEQPRLNKPWDLFPCFGICQGNDTQDLEDQCAERLVSTCEFPCDPVFYNTEQDVQGFCPDGNPYYFVVPSGSFTSTSQYQADLIAFTYGFKFLNRHKICLSEFSAIVCEGSSVYGQITATGKFTPFKFEIITGYLPLGVSMTQTDVATILIEGTPIQTGSFPFTIRVKDTGGAYMDKTFTIKVIGISTYPVLLDGTAGVAYSEQLVAFGFDSSASWHVSSGILPDGLALDPTSGLISGTPTTSGGNSFSIAISGSGQYCSKSFSLNIKVPVCAIPPFPPQTIAGNIDGFTNDPFRPGFFAQIIPFNGVIGYNLNLFMVSSVYYEYLELVDPDGILIASQDSFGVHGVAIQSLLVKTGVYQIIASTSVAGQTGAFMARISSGPVSSLAVPVTLYTNMAYTKGTTNYLFISDGNSNKVFVVNPATNVLLLTLLIPNCTNVVDITYCPVNDTIYILYAPSVGTTLQIGMISSAGVVSGTVIDSTVSNSGILGLWGGMTYDSTNNRIVIVGYVTSSPNFVVLDCSSNTVGHPLTLGPEKLVKPAYVSTSNKYYVSAFSTVGNIYKVDAVAFGIVISALQSSINFASPITYISDVDRLVFRDHSGVVAFMNPGTDTIVAVTLNISYVSACYDPCNNEVRIVNLSSAQLVCYDYLTLNQTNSINIGGSTTVEGPIFVDINSKTYTVDRTAAKRLYATP